MSMATIVPMTMPVATIMAVNVDRMGGTVVTVDVLGREPMPMSKNHLQRSYESDKAKDLQNN